MLAAGLTEGSAPEWLAYLVRMSLLLWVTRKR
jgi:hypothetical protein